MCHRAERDTIQDRRPIGPGARHLSNVRPEKTGNLGQAEVVPGVISPVS